MKKLAARLQQNAQIGFENILYELKSILETYLDKLNEEAPAEADPENVAEIARLLARTVEYKHEQLLKLSAEVNAYGLVVKLQGGRQSGGKANE